MCFLSLRQRTDTVQALVSVSEGKVSKQMVKWTAGLQDESIILVEGTVTVPPEIIKSASVGNVELHISKVSFFSFPKPMHPTERTIRSIWFLDWRHDCLSPLKTQPVPTASWRMLKHSSTEYCWIRVSTTAFLTYGYASILIALHPDHRPRLISRRKQTKQFSSCKLPSETYSAIISRTKGSWRFTVRR